jgi:hypothetical protein
LKNRAVDILKIKCAPNIEQVACSLQGVLAQAKNGDQVFWEEKFHAANGKAQACIQGALLFFLLCLSGWKWCPPFTYIGGPKGRNYIFQNRAFCFGEST